MKLFENRKLVIANMHKKEEVLKPLLEESLKVECVVPESFNTDIFGTFTQDIKRRGDMLEAARAKAKEAMKISGCDLAVASEGSFGPDPRIPFVPSNLELILLIDAKNNFEVRGHYRTHETNIDGKYVSSIEEALTFAQHIGFPEHGVIIRRKKDKKSMLYKNIESEQDLTQAISKILSLPFHSKVYIETDMRAYKNPTRMLSIKKATENLITSLESVCPKCDIPGFIATDTRGFLACSVCKSPTDIPAYEIHSCSHCSFETQVQITKYGKEGDPGMCHYCNP